eukprot:m.356366 g.356366  ORF g.356366 m.356366 type:complete len:315 (-) comp17520_c0_seq1:179-1123(-)
MLRQLARPSAALARTMAVSTRALSDESVELLTRAQTVYADHDQSIYKRPVEAMEFKVGQFNGNPTPEVSLFGESPRAGVTIVSPFAMAGSCNFGPQGNLGVTKKFKSGSVAVHEPQDAKQELSFSDEPLVDGTTNQPMVDFFTWLEEFRAKFVQHLVDNLDAYPDLSKKFGVFSGPGLYDGMLASHGKLYSEWTNSESEAVRFFDIQQRVYKRKAEGQSPRIMTPIDEQLSNKFARNHVRMFDAAGETIPIDDAVLHRQDVIACTFAVGPRVYNVAGNVGFGLRKNLYTITRIHTAKSAETAGQQKSTFGDLSS